MLPSEIPKLTTDIPVRGFLLCGNLSFMTPSPGQVLVPKSFVYIFAFCILSDLLLKRLLTFWMPGVLCQSSEVVLWKLLNFQTIF